VLVPTLAAGLDSGDPAAVDGCLDCLLKVCEDAPEWMAADATQVRKKSQVGPEVMDQLQPVIVL
jgi:hypothetical protein